MRPEASSTSRESRRKSSSNFPEPSPRFRNEAGCRGGSWGQLRRIFITRQQTEPSPFWRSSSGKSKGIYFGAATGREACGVSCTGFFFLLWKARRVEHSQVTCALWGHYRQCRGTKLLCCQIRGIANPGQGNFSEYAAGSKKLPLQQTVQPLPSSSMVLPWLSGSRCFAPLASCSGSSAVIGSPWACLLRLAHVIFAGWNCDAAACLESVCRFLIPGKALQRAARPQTEECTHLKEIRVIFIGAHQSQRGNVYKSLTAIPYVPAFHLRKMHKLIRGFSSSQFSFQSGVPQNICFSFLLSKHQPHQNFSLAAICNKQNTTPFAIYSTINL